jgi:hypothetical protein
MNGAGCERMWSCPLVRCCLKCRVNEKKGGVKENFFISSICLLEPYKNKNSLSTRSWMSLCQPVGFGSLAAGHIKINDY